MSSEEIYERPLHCKECGEVTAHIITERGFDSVTKRHKVDKYCNICGQQGRMNLTSAQFKALLDDSYY